LSNLIKIGTILLIIGGCCGAIVIILFLISICDVESCFSSCSSLFYSCKTSHERKKTQREEERKKRAEQRQRQRAMRSYTYQPESELGDQRIDLEDRSHSPLYQPSSQPIQPLPDEVVAQGEQDESGQTFIPVSVILARMQAGEM
ncbi:hypothetical protein ADUPG1_000583, partial [Aduncisulcus paluster]